MGIQLRSRPVQVLLCLGIWRFGHWTFGGINQADVTHELAVGPLYFYWTTQT
jgi:hypothetical protein